VRGNQPFNKVTASVAAYREKCKCNKAVAFEKEGTPMDGKEGLANRLDLFLQIVAPVSLSKRPSSGMSLRRSRSTALPAAKGRPKVWKAQTWRRNWSFDLAGRTGGAEGS